MGGTSSAGWPAGYAVPRTSSSASAERSISTLAGVPSASSADRRPGGNARPASSSAAASSVRPSAWSSPGGDTPASLNTMRARSGGRRRRDARWPDATVPPAPPSALRSVTRPCHPLPPRSGLRCVRYSRSSSPSDMSSSLSSGRCSQSRQVRPSRPSKQSARSPWLGELTFGRPARSQPSQQRDRDEVQDGRRGVDGQAGLRRDRGDRERGDVNQQGKDGQRQP